MKTVCATCDKPIRGEGVWVFLNVGKVRTEALVCKTCAKTREVSE